MEIIIIGFISVIILVGVIYYSLKEIKKYLNMSEEERQEAKDKEGTIYAIMDIIKSFLEFFIK